MAFEITVTRNNRIVFECVAPERSGQIDDYERNEEPACQCFVNLIKLFIHHNKIDSKLLKEQMSIIHGYESMSVTFTYEHITEVFEIMGLFENYGTIRLSRMVNDIFN
jgi:hypothetical protein